MTERATATNGPDSTFVYIEVAGQIFDDWTDYSVTSDLLEPCSHFSFHVPIISKRITAQTFARTLRKGARVKIFVKTPNCRQPVLVLCGIIDEFLFEEERNKGAVVQVTGRCHMAPIVDGDLLERFDMEKTTFKDLIKRVLVTPAKGRSRGYFDEDDVMTSADTARQIITGKVQNGIKLSKDAPPELETMKVDQAEPHPGETVYQFLHRHALRFGVLIWGTANGKIVFGRPRYDQPSCCKVEMKAEDRGFNNNAKKMGRTDSMKHRASEVHVFGHSARNNTFGSPVHVVVYDEEVMDAGFYKPLVIHDNNARDNDQATQRAKNEQSKRNQTGDVVHALLEGYDMKDSGVFAIDTMIDVDWEKGNVSESRYVIRRTFTRSRGAGTETMIDLIPKNSIALGEVQYITKFPPKGVVEKINDAVPEVATINTDPDEVQKMWPDDGSALTDAFKARKGASKIASAAVDALFDELKK